MLVNYITCSTDVPAGILIFLPGVQEMRQCIAAISSVVTGDGVDIYPLHANLSSGEQRAVFKVSKKWKIIAATNVAEASVGSSLRTIVPLISFDRRPLLSMTWSMSLTGAKSRKQAIIRTTGFLF